MVKPLHCVQKVWVIQRFGIAVTKWLNSSFGSRGPGFEAKPRHLVPKRIILEIFGDDHLSTEVVSRVVLSAGSLLLYWGDWAHMWKPEIQRGRLLTLNDICLKNGCVYKQLANSEN